MHSVLHDWPDDTCRKILANVTEAMRPGYSRLLINEHVIPDKNAHWETTALDITLMAVLNSRERTHEDWVKLVTSAGMRIVNIYTKGIGAESLIECELAE